jgi:Mg-chelatase subunit ChlD
MSKKAISLRLVVCLSGLGLWVLGTGCGTKSQEAKLELKSGDRSPPIHEVPHAPSHEVSKTGSPESPEVPRVEMSPETEQNAAAPTKTAEQLDKNLAHFVGLRSLSATTSLGGRSGSKKVAVDGLGAGSGIGAGIGAGIGDAVMSHPKRTASGNHFKDLAEGPIIATGDDSLSTFAVDVDRASYRYAARSLAEGYLPEPASVRIEEFINSFPRSGQLTEQTQRGRLLLSARRMPAPWAADDRQILELNLQGPMAKSGPRKPLRLTFLVDVSGSMQGDDRLGLIQQGLQELVKTLRPEDQIALVVYAGAAGLVLEPTSVQHRSKILRAIADLESGGSTAGGEGILLAYQTAQKMYAAQAVNRVILATDGDFNVGIDNDSVLVRLVEAEKHKGVALTVLGVGMGNLQDSRMEMLADRGDGNYHYLGDLRDAKRALVTEQQGTLRTLAKDAKIQVAFDPQVVAHYRLIGYENRALAHQDFRDDHKDGGEIGEGHSVTALYEIWLKPGAPSDTWGRFQVRSKAPESGSSQEQVLVLSPATVPAVQGSWAVVAAGLGLKLRGSPWVEKWDWEQLAVYGRKFQNDAAGSPEDRQELLKWVTRAAKL